MLIFAFLFSVLGLKAAAADSSDSSGGFETGVKAGDWILYQVFATDTIVDNMEWAKVEILNVFGMNITYHVRIHYNNIPEDNLTVNCDMRKLVQGYEFLYGRLAGEAPLFVPLSFTAGNFTYDFLRVTLDWREPLFRQAIKWNYTQSMKNFGGIQREVNMINETYFCPYDLGQDQSFYSEYCWDARTGVLSEERGIQYSPFQKGGLDPKAVDRDFILKIVDTNLWEMPHPSSNQTAKIGAFAGTLGVVIVIPAVFLLRRKEHDEKDE